MDLLQGEEIIATYLTFYETEPVNNAFAFFGIGDKNMINNTGSYFFIFLGLYFYMTLKWFFNKLAVCLACYFYPRLMGMWAYEDRYGQNVKTRSIKLFMESYFDLTFACSVNVLAFMEVRNLKGLEPFFGTPLDIACSVIVIIYACLLVFFPLYGLVTIWKNQEILDKKEMYRSLQPFLEGLKLNRFHSSMYNV
jgi:hypothetical protein